MKKIISLVGVLALPSMVSAQELEEFADIATGVGSIVDILIPIAFSLVFLIFFWGVAMYVVKAGDEEAQKKARSIMIYGVIGIAVVASIYGLVGFLAGAFGVGGTGTLEPPTIN